MSNRQFFSGFVILMIVAAVLGVGVGLKVVMPRMMKSSYPENPKTTMWSMTVGETTFRVEVRDNNAGRELGLSGRESMPMNEGVLFVFDKPDRPVFWMKDMLFPLDVVWIRDGIVVGVQENVPAPNEDSPIARTMVPAVEVDSVLELNAGVVQKQEITVGDLAVIDR